ncbi:hypothetical protein IFE17_11430 [Actinobacillus sp. GY-402]|nr:hypothetical protein IFE17_11430 [Actinobacillus sp. GY-402]
MKEECFYRRHYSSIAELQAGTNIWRIQERI